MNRRQTLTLAAVAALAAAGGAGMSVLRQPGSSVVDAADLPADFWQQRFAKPEGGELALADLRGKPLLINFWATWCAPCVRELPEIDRFAKQQGAAGVQVLGLAIDQAGAVRDFLKGRNLGLPIGLAGMAGSELSRLLGNTQGALPFTVLINAEGRLTQRKLGETHLKELSGWSDALKQH